MTSTTIDHGEGSFERTDFEGPVTHVPRIQKVGSRMGKRLKSSDRLFEAPVAATPGLSAKNVASKSLLARFRGAPGFPSYSRFGIPDGMNKEQAEIVWQEARVLAKEDMMKINEVMDLSTMAQEAMEETLVVMRGAATQDVKLRAARQILDFAMAKPVAKSEVTVNKAEAWLASLGNTDEDDQG